MAKTVYLANPYGMSAQQKELLLPPIVAQLEALGLEVWEPFERNNQFEFIDFHDEGWAFQVGQRDFEDVQNADATFAVVNGCPPAEGVMIEVGTAIALRKPIFLFRDDIRRVSDTARYPIYLMIFTGLPEHGWEEHYYTSVEEISSPQKALAHWAADVSSD